MKKVALIGAGNIAQAHWAGWQQQTEVRLDFVVDVDSERAQKRAAEWGASQWATDYHQALADDSIIAVDICLPHYLHAPVALDCLQAGKHVLVEKPVATTLSDAERMIAVARDTNLCLMVAENWRFAPVVVRAQEIVFAGGIGQPLMIKGSLEFAAPAQVFAGKDNWHTSLQKSGGGILIDSGVHLISVLRMLMGEIESIKILQGKHLMPGLAPLEDTVAGISLFESGAIGVFDMSWVVPRPDYLFRFEVIGTKGLIDFNLGDGRLYLTQNQERRLIFEQTGFGFEQEIEHFVTCILTGKQPMTTAEDETKTLAAVLAAYQNSGRNF